MPAATAAALTISSGLAIIIGAAAALDVDGLGGEEGLVPLAAVAFVAAAEAVVIAAEAGALIPGVTGPNDGVRLSTSLLTRDS